ncbi:hypothetical protein NG798_17875 [Ancylothrix sp. C2]|uniref:hypothetical protein n=1 Tax=Ancylothrix sp. D3o TaxID=2953691 RepID=UPI0021BB5515|nr:hypothetical protein [Ancylothrix sp. D3o]MCT7951674.1 hypothetical protein [Ancylothrix sp. D3o]
MKTTTNISSEIEAIKTVSLTIGLFLISIPLLLLTLNDTKKSPQSVQTSNA